MSSSRSDLSRRQPKTPSGPVTILDLGGWMLAVLLLPRILRMLYPEVWVEDDFYLESSWLVSAGMRPYLDFVHPHMPLLEWLTALYLKIFGASHFSIELLNESAIFLTSILTYALARRIADRPAAIFASIIYAYSSLIFRYHVYERESFIAPLFVLAGLIALDDSIAEIRQAAAIGAIFFVACAIKLTSVVPLVTVIGFTAVAYRRIWGAIATGLILAFLLTSFITLLYWRYGTEFIFQTFIFHFMKGRDALSNGTYQARIILDLSAPLFILGIAVVTAGRKINRGIALVLAIVGVEYLFYGVLSPTAWGHNFLEVMPFVAIFAGVGAERLLVAIGHRITAEEHRRSDWITAVAGGALLVVGLTWATPLVNQNWLHGAVYGFGFVPKAEIAQLAAAIRNFSAPGDDVIAPSFLSFEANRRELIRFPETYGVYREARDEYARDGFFAARRHLGNANFFDLIGETSHFWTDQMRAAIAAGKVPVVINDSPIQLLPLVSIPDEFLTANGYQPVLETDHFRVWARMPATAGK
jgi:dolichyl-phosphate-mannose-protein mannosyltransferase